MDIETYREYCIAKKGVTESFPFDDKVLVFKVLGKMFALCNVEEYSGFNLKCDPERAIELRESYQGIIPGYHMSKKHWNTVRTYADVPDRLAFELIDHSYNLVAKSLKKSDREKLELNV